MTGFRQPGHPDWLGAYLLRLLSPLRLVKPKPLQHFFETLPCPPSRWEIDSMPPWQGRRARFRER